MIDDEALDESIREVSDLVAKAHLALFLYQAIGFGLAFAIWQVFELEQPWYLGPWHFLYFGWLVIDLAYAQYARKCRDLASAAIEFVCYKTPGQSGRHVSTSGKRHIANKRGETEL